MKTREVIKYFSIAGGTTLLSPFLFNLLNSCKQAENDNLNFFTELQFQVVNQITQVVLPKTDTIGAIDLNLVSFIDKCIFHLEDEKNKKKINKGFEFFIEYVEDKVSKKIINFNLDNYNESLKELLSVSEEELKRINDMPSNNSDNETHLRYFFLIKIRYYCLLGFFTSKEVMVDLMDYESIPGEYVEIGV